MQINPLPQPAPIGGNATPQAVSQALPAVQALAAAPLTQRAVAPPPKAERGHKGRTNKEESDGGDDEEKRTPPGDTRGHFVNTSA